MRDLRKSHVFKQQNCNWRKNALVGDYFSSDLELYIEGYYSAATLLLDKIETGEPSNILVYPICFLYSHFIEIALKEIIARCERLRQSRAMHKSFEIKKAKTHKLSSLLNNANKLVREAFDTPFSEEIKQTIQEINNADPTSEMFRYATSKKGDHFFPEHDVIGLGTLKEKMARVHDELKGALIGLDEYLKTQAEINLEHIDVE
jgi:hypothetical protein